MTTKFKQLDMLKTTSGGFKIKERKSATRNSNFFTSTATSKTRKDRLSRSIVYPNRFKNYSIGNKSIFSSYVQSELKKARMQYVDRQGLPLIGLPL